MSVHKKISPIGLVVWPAIRNIYKYECLVLLYRCSALKETHHIYKELLSDLLLNPLKGDNANMAMPDSQRYL